MTNALVDINWNLAANTPNSFDRAFQRGYEMSRTIKRAEDERSQRSALAAYAANPDDTAALQTIFQLNPELGSKLMDRADDRAFRRDTAAYLAPNGQPNALLGFTPPTIARAPMGGGAQPAPANALALPTFSGGNPSGAPGGGIVATPEQQAETDRLTREFGMEGVTVQDGPSADLSMLGEPRSDADQAFLRMVQRDPIKALKIRSELRDNFVQRMEQEQEFYGIAVQALSTVQDDTGWQQATQRLAPMAQAMGTDLFSVVPRTYPGAEGVQALMQRAMPVKDQLDYLLREANVEADNARSDRNTDSMIATREARAAEYARNNRERSANQRRGQDMSGRRSGGARPPRVVSVKTPAEARALKPGTRYRGPDGVVRER